MVRLLSNQNVDSPLDSRSSLESGESVVVKKMPLESPGF